VADPPLSTRAGLAAAAAVVVAAIWPWRSPTAADAAEAPAQSARVYALPHSDERATIDGVLDDPIWKNAVQIDLTVETGPGENVPAPVTTHAYLVEDGSRLLVAFDARDPNPKAIRAYLRDRDTAYNDDFVGVVLDTFGDQRHAYEFFANPLGVQMDLSNDDVNQREDDSWDAIWDSAGRITAQGFVVEMAIPFNQLRFEHKQGERVWGIDVLRFYPRKDRMRISNNPLQRGRNCYLCQFSQLRGLVDVAPSKDMEFVPSLTASRSDARADPYADPLTPSDRKSDVGVNLRWGLSQDLTASLALNPDFSQVEADVAQLEVNNQFALFYPEKRPFFLESADHFDTPIPAVFTRAVADPDAGAKLTGHQGPNTFGLFAAKDAVTNLLFPGPLQSSTDSIAAANETFVGRYRRDISRNSTVGALITNRDGSDYSNRVAGVDAKLRFSDAQSVELQYLRSTTRYDDTTAAADSQPTGDFDGGALEARYTYSTRSWYADLKSTKFDTGFRADLGFVPQVGVAQQNLQLARIWNGATGQWWNQFRVGLNGKTTDDADGQLLERNLDPVISLQGPLQSFVQIGAGPIESFWDGQSYSGHEVFLYGQFRPRGGLNINLSARRGERVDLANSQLGFERRWQPYIEWNATRHLLVRLRHTAVHLNSKDGPKIFDAALSDLRVTWQFNVRSFVRFTTQRQRVRRNLSEYVDPTTQAKTLTVGSQLLYAYKLNPQTVLYVGYSDSTLQDDRLLDLTRTGRTLFAKLSYAWLR
jgi:Domain of unknown function (DUF5916)/Carbohydrate family 9 binding domain-like